MKRVKQKKYKGARKTMINVRHFISSRSSSPFRVRVGAARRRRGAPSLRRNAPASVTRGVDMGARYRRSGGWRRGDYREILFFQRRVVKKRAVRRRGCQCFVYRRRTRAFFTRKNAVSVARSFSIFLRIRGSFLAD